MPDEQSDLLREIKAENSVIFCFMRAVIATHHSPQVLLDAFNLSHDQFIGDLLATPAAIEAAIDRVQAQRDRLAGAIEARLRQMRGAAPASSIPAAGQRPAET